MVTYFTPETDSAGNAAGFREARDERPTITLTIRSVEDYMENILKTTPLGMVLDEHPAEHVNNVWEAARRSLGKFR